MAKILVADDDQAMLGLLTTLMELEGDTTVTVTRPEKVVPVAQREKPELILMDYHLAGGNSLAALHELKNSPELSSIPVLMTSGMDCERECLKAGANDFILKPFRPTELIARMRVIMNEGT